MSYSHKHDCAAAINGRHDCSCRHAALFSIKIPCSACHCEMVPVRAERLPGKVRFVGNERCLACGAMNAIDIDIRFRYLSVVKQAMDGLGE